MAALTERLQAARLQGTDNPVLPASVDKFLAHVAVEAFKTILEDKHLLKEEEAAVGEMRADFIWRPAFEHTVFFLDLRPEHLAAVSAGLATMQLIGVHTNALAAEMKKRGYVQVAADFPGSFPGLPPPLVAQTRPVGESSSKGRLNIGCFKPTMKRTAKSAPPDDQLIGFFEQGVTDSHGVEYAPLYEWTQVCAAPHPTPSSRMD